MFATSQPANWRVATAISIGLSLVLGIILAYLYTASFVVHPDLPSTPLSDTYYSCMQTSIALLKVDKIDTDTLHKIDALCYDHVHWAGLLNDFSIRRSKVIQQNSEDIILLWMVVSITVSGVILAGLQLMGSYRLASAGKGEFSQQSEVSFEARGNMSLKSSVTGLIILITSFAFFLVYVTWVYPIQTVRLDTDIPVATTNAGQSVIPTTQNLGLGGLGNKPAPTGKLAPSSKP
jgi:hypothetical protein